MSAKDGHPDRANPLRMALREGRSGLALVAVFSFFINLLILTSPLYMLQMFDRVLSSGRIETLVYLTLIAGVAVLVMGLLEMIRGRILGRIGRWLDRRLSPDVIAASMRGATYGLRPNAQPLRDLETIRSFLSGTGINAVFDSPWVPLFLTVVWLLHPVLGAISVAAAVVLFVAAGINEYVSRRLLKQATQATIANMQEVESAGRNAEVFHAMGMLTSFLRSWLKRNDDGLALQLSANDRNSVIVGFSRFFRLFVQIGILGAGAYLVLRGELTSGGMIAASILLGRALAPVEQAIGTWKGLVAARDAYRRLDAMLNGLPDHQDYMPLPPPTGQLTCERIMYMVPGRDQPVLNGVSFGLKAGEALGILGPSAAGKSSLCKILVGAWYPTRGHARLDGADLSAWPPEQRGPHIGYLPQDVELFAGSVKNNIARLAENPDPAAVVEAAVAAGVHETILRMPQGYETEIGEGGGFLSGGQRQRVGLARALFGRPKLIILDEPNANLDNEGENALLAAIEKAKNWGATVVLVAHQPRILQVVDTLLLLRDGRIEMFGPCGVVLNDLRSRREAAKAAPTSTQRLAEVSAPAPVRWPSA